MVVQAKGYICGLSPYQPSTTLDVVARKYGHQPADIVQLASNENPLGPSPKALAVLHDALHQVHRYPDQHELIHALSGHYDVNPDMVTLGNGSNDVLDLIARTYLGAGDEAISSRHSFAVYQVATRSAGAENIVVPTRGFTHDPESLLRAITPSTKVLWLDNPGNPTGTFLPYDTVEALAAQVPKRVLVVLDEAYYEYLDPASRTDTIRWLAKYPNLILVRTFSKIYGLAGLRVGYALASPKITELLNRVRHPFNANSLAIQAAVSALGDQHFVQTSYEQNRADRKQLIDGLQAYGLKTLPAHGNFVTVQVAQAREIYEGLLRAGIIVRPLSGYGMPDFLRVSVGSKQQNERLLNALAGILPAVQC